MKYLLPKVPRYFKTALHCHTNISDGTPSREEMKELYKARGYQVLSITDHNVIADHSDMNEEEFLMLTGVEYNITEPIVWAENRLWARTYHLNFIAKRPDNLWQPFLPEKNFEAAQPYVDKADVQVRPRVYSVEAMNELIAEANERGFMVTYNHPGWSMQSYPDYAGLKGLWAMEISNTDCVPVKHVDQDNGRVYADLVSLGNDVVPVAADDAHTEPFVGGGWVMVGAEKLEYGAVIQALEKGDMYSSIGPEIKELSIDEGKLHIECSDVKRIAIESGTRTSRLVRPENPEETISEATIDLSGWITACIAKDDPRNWIRVIIMDADGKYATTRAYRAKELL